MSETSNESNSGMLAVSIISAVGGIGTAIINTINTNKQQELEALELAQQQEITKQAELNTIGGIPIGVVYALLGVFVVLIILGVVFRKK